MPKRKVILLFLGILAVMPLKAQIFDPVTWTFGYEKKGDKLYDLIITAEIEKGSHIYSLDIPEGGPIATSIRFDTISDFSLEGIPWEVTEPEEIFDEAFGFKIKSFNDRAEFRQKINTRSPSFRVTGEVTYMACNNMICSPPKDIPFEININDSGITQEITSAGEIDEPAGRKGLLGFLILSLVAGFAGILTPCVFPMIPMTVAFFSQGSENRRKSVLKAIIFGVSIILIYTSLGIIVSLTSAGAGFANTLSTHWIPNIIFFALFVLFAVSFFGAFEIILPNKWVTGTDSKIDKGGILAAFFMGLTTVIISFSCTGPIVGALLVEAASGDVLKPTLGMFGFGLAFALPFTLFALFPSVMNRMPKSGGWLNSVKVVLGFIMLIFSLKFLMTIDSVYSFGILSRDIFLSIWIILFALLGLYLMGKIKFTHDSDLKHIGTFRLFLIITVFSFMLYLIPGLFGAPLKGLSAFLPAQETSWFYKKPVPAESNTGPAPAFGFSSVSELCSESKYENLFEMPLGLMGYFDYDQGLACAREQGKPALIDFKGHACANCKVMEAKVWSDPEILQRLRDNFVIISLYADDRTQLPEDEWITSAIDGKVKKTIGKINEDIEISRYKTNALPLYVIADYEGNPLNNPMPTNLNIEEYKNWLDEGVRIFNVK